MFRILGIRLMVGHLILVQVVRVRLLHPQPQEDERKQQATIRVAKPLGHRFYLSEFLVNRVRTKV